MSRVYKFHQGSNPTHQFLEMHPSPQGVQSQSTYFARTQVNGVSIYLDGVRGRMFQMRTLADSEDAQSAEALVKEYEDACGQVWEITYDSQNYGNYLIDSVAAHASPIVKMIGGKNHADPKYIVEAQWNVFPINPAP